MRTLFVKITEPSEHPQCWYYNRVGEVFQVYEWAKDYVLKEDYDKGYKFMWRHIDKEDCVEVVREESDETKKQNLPPARPCPPALPQGTESQAQGD